MHTLLEKLLWKSEIGSQIKGDALAEIEVEETALAAQVKKLEAERDARIEELNARAAGFAAQLQTVRAVIDEAEFRARGLRRDELSCGYEIDQVRNRCRRDVNAAQVRLRELAEARSQLHDHGH